jgi:hypothetical protein
LTSYRLLCPKRAIRVAETADAAVLPAIPQLARLPGRKYR